MIVQYLLYNFLNQVLFFFYSSQQGMGKHALITTVLTLLGNTNPEYCRRDCVGFGWWGLQHSQLVKEAG